MKRGFSILGALGVGAGLMYLFDPQVGNRRRSLIRDRAVSLLNQSDRFIEKAGRDMRNRARGVLAETNSKLNETEALLKSQAQVRNPENWSPTARVVSGAGGLALLANGMARGGLLGTVLSLTGLGLVTRGLTNQRLNRLLGLSPARNAVDIQKTANIDAPVEEVYRFWENAENFPRFMEHVREIMVNGDNYHWTVAGSAGMPVEFDTLITRKEQNRLIAWESRPNEAVKSAGTVQFRPNAGGGTRVTVHMSYTPPAGAVGHAVATMFGVNPKQAMDSDLARMKSLLEAGRTSAGGKQVSKEQVSR